MTHPVIPHRAPRWFVAAAAAFVCMTLAPAGARAADLFVDAGLSIELSDDARFFLNLSNRQYAPPQPVAVDVLKRCQRPADDFPVVLFLAEVSHKSPSVILEMRLKGQAWGEIMTSIKVAPDVLFTGMDRDPGPPYGRAWGYWKKQRAAGAKSWRLDDPDIVALAKLQTVSAYYRVSPYRVSTEVQRGVTVEAYAVAHGQPPVAIPAKHPNAGKTKGKGHGGPRYSQQSGPHSPYAPQGGPQRQHH